MVGLAADGHPASAGSARCVASLVAACADPQLRPRVPQPVRERAAGFDPGATPIATAAATPAQTATPAPTATPSPTPTGVPSCAQLVLTGMTEEQRIGQLFLLGLADDRLGPAELGAIRDEHVGSVWFTAQTSIGIAGVRAVAQAVQGEVNPSSTAGVASSSPRTRRAASSRRSMGPASR